MRRKSAPGYTEGLTGTEHAGRKPGSRAVPRTAGLKQYVSKAALKSWTLCLCPSNAGITGLIH